MLIFRKTKLSLARIKHILTEAKFPFWFKYVAYALAFIFSGISLFFIISQSIMLGDDKVKKWITSLFISFVSSILLTNPVKAAIVSFVLVTILRSADDKKELDNDKDDDNKLNNYVATNDVSLSFF